MNTQPFQSKAAAKQRLSGSLTPADGIIAVAMVLIVGLWIYTRTPRTQGDQEHVHPPGNHGGVIISLARDRYHAEALVEQGGVLRLITLGRSPDEVIDVETQELVAYVDGGESEVVPVPLRPEPQAGDHPGRTSQFTGQLPSQLFGKPIKVTVAALRIDEQRYRLGFAWPVDGAHQTNMPDKVQDEAERRLYLEPGGVYTLADIEANDRLTASEKFAGFKAQHDYNPLPGDLLCPITQTKANPNCSWIIAGRRYTFCCPPCIDEFLALAKEQPDQVQLPDAYVK